jgi:hypothetical protein
VIYLAMERVRARLAPEPLPDAPSPAPARSAPEQAE